MIENGVKVYCVSNSNEYKASSKKQIEISWGPSRISQIWANITWNARWSCRSLLFFFAYRSLALFCVSKWPEIANGKHIWIEKLAPLQRENQLVVRRNHKMCRMFLPQAFKCGSKVWLLRPAHFEAVDTPKSRSFGKQSWKSIGKKWLVCFLPFNYSPSF